MKTLTIEKRGKSVSESDIGELENRFSIALPADYKTFLLTQNPNRVAVNSFGVGDDAFYLIAFFPLDSDISVNLKTVNEEFFKEEFKSKYFAFAADHGGWIYVLGLENEQRGNVFLFRLDTPIPEGLMFVASAFEEFVDGLYREE